jgi:hypothetical protein
MLILTHLVPLKFQQKQQQQGEEQSAQHGSETSSFLREKMLGFEIIMQTYITERKKSLFANKVTCRFLMGGDNFLLFSKYSETNAFQLPRSEHHMRIISF